MRIIVENTVCLNTGDAAILLAVRHIVRKIYGDDVRLDVFDSQPDVASRLYDRVDYPDITFRKLLSESVFKKKYPGHALKNFAKYLYNSFLMNVLVRYGQMRSVDRRIFTVVQRSDIETYRQADLVITTGGTYLVETYNLDRRLRQFRIDCAFRKPPVFFTQSLGPFNKTVNRKRLTPILDRSPLVLLRDERSRENLLGLVADRDKCHVVADSVFALAETERIEGLVSGRHQRAGTGRVAVSVRHWNYVEGGEEGMRRYIDSVREMVTALVTEHGKSVTFLSTCQGVPEYAHDDSRTARAIVAELEPAVAGRVDVDGAFHRPEELMALAKDFDFVISTRMHMMIMSLCVGTPVLPIAYEFKTRELAKRIGVSDVLLDIDTMTPEEARGKLESFIAALPDYTRTSLTNTLAEHASAMSAADLLRAAFPDLAQVSRDAGKGVQQSAA